VTRPCPCQRRFVIDSWDLLCLTHIQISPTEVSMTSCQLQQRYEKHAKYKNSHFDPPFGGLRGNAQVWLDEKAQCGLPISDN